MENYRILISIAFLVILLVPQAFSYAYSGSTHKNLTKNILNEYSRLGDTALSPTDQAMIVSGSATEDDGMRPLYHFFDPVNNKGLDDLVPGVQESSVQWAENPFLQGNYKNYLKNDTNTKLFKNADDYSLNRAVYEYVHGDKSRALRSLGQVLHLVEDLTSVPHTRDDAHGGMLLGGNSYYEDYTKGLVPDISVPSIAHAQSLDSIMNATALYTNNNFLSKDTIFKNYALPTVNTSKTSNNFLLNNLGGKLIHAKITQQKSGTVAVKNLKLNNHQVMQSYWEHLSARTVNDGVALLDLFFREVAKERQTNDLAKMNMSYNEVKLTFERFGGFGIAKKLYGSSLAASDVAELNKDKLEGALAANEYYKIDAPNEDAIRRALAESNGNKKPNNAQLAAAAGALLPQHDDNPEPQPEPSTSEPDTEPVNEPEVVSEPATAPVVEQVTEPTTEQVPEPAPEAEPEPEAQPSAPNPFEPGGYAYGAGGGGGGGSAAADDSEDEDTEEKTVDTEAPDVTLTIAECADSYAGDNDTCMLIPTTLTLTWESSASDIDYYELSINDIITQSTSTTATTTISDNESVDIVITAYDTSGNSSSSTQTVSAFATPIVLNEVAWKGTDADPGDQWIELYNRSDVTVDLNGFTAQTNATSTHLTGSIASGGYYLIEAREEATDETANHIFNFALNSNGEELTLMYASSTVDSIDTCTGSCGSVSSAYSAERWSPDEDSWDRWNTAVSNAKDASGNNVHGTPKWRNSINHEIDLSNTITSDTTLTAEHSPYIITTSDFTIPAGVTLTIEEGVVIKFQGGSSTNLDVAGTLVISGTEENPVILTSLKDDSVGGDTNGDEADTVPVAGVWGTIHFTDTSTNSMLAHTEIAYGGRRYDGWSRRGALWVENADVNMDAVVVRAPEEIGLYLYNSDSIVQNSTFEGGEFNGIYVEGGSPEFDHCVIYNADDDGMYLVHTPNAQVRNSTFTDNINYAIDVVGVMPMLSGNSGSGNGYDAISIPSGVIVGTTGTTTLYANDLDYRLTGASSVPTDGILTFEVGTTIRATRLGRLEIDGGTITFAGDSPEDLIFTSAAQTPTPGSWYGIYANNGSTFNMSGFTIQGAGRKHYSIGGYALKIGKATSTVVIAHALIEDNNGEGIYINKSTVEINDATIQNNNWYGLHMNTTNASLSDVLFSGHSQYDIYGTASSTVTCTNCGTYTADVN